MTKVDLRVLRLRDLYGALLTPTQREIFDLYYNCDLSLSEIAESKGISRQGVQECLKKSKGQLEEYEGALRVLETADKSSDEASRTLSAAARWAEDFAAAHPEFSAETDDLLNILSNGLSGGADASRGVK